MISASDIRFAIFGCLLLVGLHLVFNVFSDDEIIIEPNHDFERYLETENVRLKAELNKLKQERKQLKTEIKNDSIFIYSHASDAELDSLRAVAFGL